MTSEVLAEVSLEDDLSRRSSESVEPDSVAEISSPHLAAFSYSPELIQRWLGWQCQMIAGNLRGFLLIPDPVDHSLKSAGGWPESTEPDKALFDLCSQALRERGAVIQAFQPSSERSGSPCDLIAIPLFQEGYLFAVVGLVLTPRSQMQRTALIQLVQWGSVWLDAGSASNTNSQAVSGDHASLVELVSHPNIEMMAAELVQMTAVRFNCLRVSIASCEELSVHPLASTSDNSFSLNPVMMEVADQQVPVCFPASAESSRVISFAHQQYHSKSDNALLSVPLIDQGQCIAVMVLERAGDFSATEQQQLITFCRGVPGLMSLLLQSNRTLSQHLREKLWGLSRLSGGGLKRYRWLTVGAVCIATLILLPAEYRVSAPASIEALDRQFLVAPYDGYIRTIEARAGDRVVKGQTLLYLDDRELQLQQRKWLGEKEKLEREYQDALARGERSRLSILRARIDQISAEVDLVTESIHRSRVTAPFDGVLVSSAALQSPGAAIAIGESLFEIAPLDRYRIVLEVGESRMAGIVPGKEGELIFTAAPDESHRFYVERILPAARVTEQGNHFRVEAALSGGNKADSDSRLRPGMQGLAKVEMGERSLFWILTHRLADRLKLWFWSLGG